MKGNADTPDMSEDVIRLKGCISSFEKGCWIGASDAEAMIRSYDYARFEDPLMFQTEGLSYRISSDGIHVEPIYSMGRAKYEALRRGCVMKARAIMSELPDTSDRRMLVGLHSYICDNIRYRHVQDAHEAVGPLIRGTGVCEGISKMVKVVCDIAGVPCHLAVSSTDGPDSDHMWNLVMVDGRWYNADFTADLRCEDTGRSWMDCFLVSDRNFGIVRDNWEWIVCDSEDQDPFLTRGLSFGSIDDARGFMTVKARAGCDRMDFRLERAATLDQIHDVLMSVLTEAGWRGSFTVGMGGGRNTYFVQLNQDGPQT